MSNINPDIENYSDEDIYSYIEQSDDSDEEHSNWKIWTKKLNI